MKKFFDNLKTLFSSKSFRAVIACVLSYLLGVFTIVFGYNCSRPSVASAAVSSSDSGLLRSYTFYMPASFSCNDLGTYNSYYSLSAFKFSIQNYKDVVYNGSTGSLPISLTADNVQFLSDISGSTGSQSLKSPSASVRFWFSSTNPNLNIAIDTLSVDCTYNVTVNSDVDFLGNLLSASFSPFIEDNVTHGLKFTFAFDYGIKVYTIAFYSFVWAVQPYILNFNTDSDTAFNAGYSQGLLDGTTSATSDDIQSAYNRGYTAGDFDGYNRGIAQNANDINPVRVIIDSAQSILSFTPFGIPNLTLGTLLLIPFGFIIFKSVIHLFGGG